MQKILILLTLLCTSVAHAASPVLPKHSVIATAHPLATQAGIEILNKGGNAFDAAAAIALTIGVAEPTGSGIGGGGFFLLYIAKQGRYIMLDARETAPKLAGHGEIYQNSSSINGPQSAGVPGLVAGVDHLIRHYGRLSRKENASHAINIARNGFRVSEHYQRVASWRKDILSSNSAGNIFLQQGKVPELGERILQPALAETLTRFAKFGSQDFYQGETAKRLVADMKRDGGLIRQEDLNSYKVIEREPVRFTYQGFEWISASLPSSGGITLAETLGILADDKLQKLERIDAKHLLIEAMKLAYKDRNQHLGDADFVSIPDLLKPSRLQKLRNQITMNKALPAISGAASEPSGNGVDTTHFSIIDQEGNMVSATLSINYGFGSGYVSPGTGILLNDGMDDFATRPGQANAYGLVQGKANGVEPGKRMLSSMTPTIIHGRNSTFIVGTPGGSRIISMVLLAGSRFMQEDGDISNWINQPRFHHQYLPDVVQFEEGAFSESELKELKKRGHQFQLKNNYGNMHAIVWNHISGEAKGASDKRGEGETASISKKRLHL